MWELSICVGGQEVEIAKFIYQTLKQQTSQFGAVVTCYEQFDNFFILVGCQAEEQGRVCMVIERCIIKVISSFYKERFLTQNLHLPTHENISMFAFKKALVNFDKETDFYLISKNLQLKGDLHLDSFYFFKLKPLREKWTELITLANENSDYLVSNEAFFDLLHFLIDNLEICEDEINVFEDDDGYSIKAHGFGQEKDFESLSKEGLVSSLIELCPKKINFFCKNDEKTAGFLSKIFEERINVCYNKKIEKFETYQ